MKYFSRNLSMLFLWDNCETDIYSKIIIFKNIKKNFLGGKKFEKNFKVKNFEKILKKNDI